MSHEGGKQHAATRSTASLQASLAALSEAEDLAATTASSLQEQKETLRGTQRKADEIEYQNTRSTRILRGMTWWGSVVNFFTPEPEPIARNSQKFKTHDDTSGSAGRAGATPSRRATQRQQQADKPAASATSQHPAGREDAYKAQGSQQAGQAEADMRHQDALLEDITASLGSLAASGQAMADSNDGVDDLLQSVETAQQGVKANARTARRF